MSLRRWVILVIVCITSAQAADVRPKPAALFSDHAVLQRNATVPIWGRADAGERIIVSFADQTHDTRADAQGVWRVNLSPMAASATPREITISGAAETVIVSNVLVGDIWVCSGQSNMTFALNRAKNAGAEVATATAPLLRLFNVPRTPSARPASDVDTQWTLCTPETAGPFSAVAYFFGRELSREIGVPLGLIHSSWGGTVAQNWSPRRVLEDPRFSKVLDCEKERLARLPEEIKKYEASLRQWEAMSPTEKAGKQKPLPPASDASKGSPSHLFNGMIAPLIPYSVRGVLWFQGESNRKDPNHYRALLPAMIKGWRMEWGQPRLPFIIVQIANYMPPEGEPDSRSQWAEIREVQRLTAQTVEDAALVVTIDLGESKDLHPKNKQDVGKRSALHAVKLVYEKSVVASGPDFKRVAMNGSAAVLEFSDVGAGLVAKGEVLTGFTVAGKDRRFLPAHAEIQGDTVIVRSDAVPEPVAVRYAWSADPQVSLYNREGLPAGPFRTDDWPWQGPTTQPNP